MNSETLERVERQTERNDNSRLAHYVNCPDEKPSTAAWVTEARVLGLPVTALCGYVWVPESDPDRHPICPACIDEAERISREEGEI